MCGLSRDGYGYGHAPTVFVAFLPHADVTRAYDRHVYADELVGHGVGGDKRGRFTAAVFRAFPMLC